MSWLLFLAILAGFSLYMASPSERAGLIRVARDFVRGILARSKQRSPASQLFFDALRTRTPLAIVTPALALVNVAVFIRMLIGAGSFADPATILSWGASFGPRTTSGEWWRLVAMMFVHVGPLHLAASLAGLVPAGLILERLVGRVAFLTTYVGAGLVAALISLTSSPIGINAGPSGAIFGVYGLFLVMIAWGLIQRSVFTIPFAVVRDLLPTAAIFLVYNVLTHRLDGSAEMAAFIAGCVAGGALVLRLDDEKPAPRKLAAMAASIAVFTLVFAVSLPAIADVRPELARTLELEGRTADAYGKQVERFKKGRTTTDALAEYIDGTILPELRAQAERFKALDGVPPQHRAMVADAETYLRLRTASWLLRSDALRKSSVAGLRRADAAEWQSLQAFAQLSQP